MQRSLLFYNILEKIRRQRRTKARYNINNHKLKHPGREYFFIFFSKYYVFWNPFQGVRDHLLHVFGKEPKNKFNIE